jgi:hypothetical protein
VKVVDISTQFQPPSRKKLKGAKLSKTLLLHIQQCLHQVSNKVLVVIGCSLGIGVATASLFAAHSFNKIALIARNALRLEDYCATVLDIAQLA